MSQLEEGFISINKSEVQLQELCESVTADLRFLMKNGKQINHQNNSGLRSFFTDKRILKNLLFNLLSNALKYSHADSQVDCFLDIRDKQLEFKIKDYGIGIPVEDQKFLFQRFFRASNVENMEGTGLGLHIVSRYVKMLNGTISFSKHRRKGFLLYSSFTLLN